MIDPNLEMGAALADLVSLAEKNAVTFNELVAALKALGDGKENKETIVNVAAPNVSVAAPNVTIECQPQAAPVVHLMEPASKTTRITVNRNPSGFIESLDVEVVTGTK